MCLSISEEQLQELAGRFGTPLYVYEESRIRENFREFKAAFKNAKICYAYKANTSLAICHILRREGAGADVVSEGELRIALKVGIKAGDIIFTNNSKTREELESALEAGVTINVDSLDELNSIAEIGKPARVSFRVNPAVNPKTHPKIATGMRESKFGLHLEDIAFEAYRKASQLDNVEILGIQMHIGSQITDMTAFSEATEKLLEFVLKLRKELNLTLKFVDIGGGLGISYTHTGDIENRRFSINTESNDSVLETPKPKDLADNVLPIIKEYNNKLGYEPELWLEPGRYLVANAGILLCEVQSVKKTPYKNFVNVDAGFNVLVRPAMYDSFHRICRIEDSSYMRIPARNSHIKVLGKSGETEKYDIAGNVCESGDILGKDRELPPVKKGDILAILDAGAYGFSMSSQYNSRPRVAEILVRENSAEVIRERESWDDLLLHQKVPGDLMK